MSEMTEDAFDKDYDPQESPSQEEGSHFWMREEVLTALALGQITEQQVWTVVDDGDGGMCTVAGWAAVNRVSHQVTRVPWSTGLETVVLDMPHSCFYCGSPIEKDEHGSWSDGVDGDGCDDSPTKVHSDDEVDD